MAEVIGLVGAIVVAAITYALGRYRDREAHLRSERIDACIDFCNSVMDYSAQQVSRRRDEIRGLGPVDDEASDALKREARSRAWASYFRVVLLVGEAEAAECREALELAAAISKLDGTVEEIKTAGERVRVETEDFVLRMAQVLGAR